MARARYGVWFRVVWVLALAAVPCFGASYRPKAADSTGDALFTGSGVRHLQIEMSEEAMETLRRHSYRARDAEQRTNVPATVRDGELIWTNVAVHLKGALGSFRPLDSKPSLTLNFDKWVDGQRFHGLEKISLNNSMQDPSYLGEKICREIYNAAGVPTPRTDYATVELNGRYLGLFVLAEGWNKQFLKRHFGSTKGNFYDLGGGRDVNRPRRAASGDAPDDHSILEAVTRAAAEPDPGRLERLKGVLDLDRFLRMTALDVLMWNWDGYALNRNNYRVFHDRESGRLVFMPHGVDQMFWKTDGPIMTGRSGLIAKSILETEAGRDLYLQSMAEVRSNAFDLHAITNRLEQLTDRLAPVLARDGVRQHALFQSAARVLRERIVARTRDVDLQLVDVKQLKRLKTNEAIRLTAWYPGRKDGLVEVDQTGTPPGLHLKANGSMGQGEWICPVWIEEGRYVIEGRVKASGVRGDPGVEPVGAGFRVWSTRKETRDASWSWFPYSSKRNRQLGGLIPVAPESAEQRLEGTTDWIPIRHEFELRQPLADLQIQAVLRAAQGEAWFDTDSIRLRRLSSTVSKGSGAVRGE
jgi:hypothetical protein